MKTLFLQIMDELRALREQKAADMRRYIRRGNLHDALIALGGEEALNELEKALRQAGADGVAEQTEMSERTLRETVELLRRHDVERSEEQVSEAAKRLPIPIGRRGSSGRPR